MANVNKKYFDEGLRHEAWSNLLSKIKNSSSIKELKSILDRFLPPSERIIFEKRLLIVLLLKKGFSYRKICQILDVHRDTISLVKNRFQHKKKDIKVRSLTKPQDIIKRKKSYPPAYKGSRRWADIEKYRSRRYKSK